MSKLLAFLSLGVEGENKGNLLRLELGAGEAVLGATWRVPAGSGLQDPDPDVS